MIYYKSRYISEKTGIPTAKWKRWVREFLPPDPLGGMRSGYARQFNLKDAFRVYLGGFLVHDLKMGIVEARNVLTDLDGWLKQNGYFALTAGNGHDPADRQEIRHLIYIYSNTADSLSYVIHTVDNERKAPDPAPRALINTAEDLIVKGAVASARMVGITHLYRGFLDRIAVKH